MLPRTPERSLYAECTAGLVSRIRGLTDYAAYNYGERSEITSACRAGDVAAFMAATKHVTEFTSARIAAVQNAVICAQGVSQ